MGYPVADGSILEMTIEGSIAGQVTLTILHYKLTDTLGLPDGDAAIDAFNLEVNDLTQLIGTYAAAASASLSIQQLRYQWIHPVRFHRVFKAPVSGVGELAGAAMPPNVAAAITKRGDGGTRRDIGTLHFPGLRSSDVVDGGIIPGQLTRLETLAVHIRAKRMTDTMIPVVFNRTNPANSVPVTGTTVQRYSRVQRRRTVGLGI